MRVRYRGGLHPLLKGTAGISHWGVPHGDTPRGELGHRGEGRRLSRLGSALESRACLAPARSLPDPSATPSQPSHGTLTPRQLKYSPHTGEPQGGRPRGT